LHGVIRNRADAISLAKGKVSTPKTVLSNGYVLEYLRPGDPYFEMGVKNSRARGRYAPKHRLVMARHLGRLLTSSETVHHINGDKTDNKLENLQLRQGSHGQGAKYVCLDCGSINIKAMELD
jgi:hypothetical protein